MNSSVIDDGEALLGTGSWVVFLSEFWADGTASCEPGKNLKQEVWAKECALENQSFFFLKKKGKKSRSDPVLEKKPTEWKILGWG